MSEHQAEHSPEQQRSAERAAEIEQAAAEALKNIEKSAEYVAENTAEKITAARELIEKQAETTTVPAAEKQAPPAAHHPTKLDKTKAYWQTVHAMQRRLKPASKQFSKLIHNPAVEKTSEFASKTVFRPSITLGATATALIVGGFFYVTARHYGFALSGSEFIVSLAAGALIGLMLEILTKPFRK